MTAAKNLPANVVSVLVEHESGVIEVFLKVSQSESAIALMPIGVRIASGALRPITPDQILHAVELSEWSESHRSLFEDCRVTE